MILYDQAVYKCARNEKISRLIIVSYGLNVKRIGNSEWFSRFNRSTHKYKHFISEYFITYVISL